MRISQKRLSDPDKTPKYGNEDPSADANARWLVDLLDRVFRKQSKEDITGVGTTGLVTGR